ncbi:MAG TPA: peptidase S14 [Lachnospiraceae bacterium]|nr:peptidase S14 [Lachnospiraceae bacterium]
MNKFWNWIRDDTGGRVLRLEGPIDNENFWGDEITPAMFREDLEAEDGDVTVWINSPGGNVFAAAEIYTMLKDYAGAVTVRIASIAASAASVIAMAGDQVQMSPTALLMIHDPSTIAMGNARDMEKAIETLNEVKESIINAYAAKSGMRRSKIADLMSEETWMNAKKALELGFCDEILFDGKKAETPEKEEALDEPADEKPVLTAHLYSTRRMDMAILNRLGVTDTAQPRAREEPQIGMDGKTEDGAVPYQILRNQLEFLR